ncbi:MAG: UPF0175 family protein [Leptospiraceae bacterium]|nr:UPF0175 family protein [Leptospiraceae bacterium]
MVLKIADQYIQNTFLAEVNLKLEFAIYLYEKDILTLEQASKLAEISYLDFQKELGNRNISIHYDEEELEKDLETLKFLDQA